MNKRELDARLSAIEEEVIRQVVSHAPGVREGKVMSLAGVAPYRRLDCDGKALCYIRRRPQKRAVRIDVSGLWCRPASSRLAVRGASGSMTLLLTSGDDVEEAASYLRSVVSATRQLAGRDRG